MRSRITTMILSLCLVFSCLAGTAQAIDHEDVPGASGGAEANTLGAIASSFEEAEPRPLAANETLRCGIDVSSYQGIIDWKAVANAGIEFAIIRVCGRGYGSGDFYDDSYYARNIQEAQANGIQVGVYIFSQAIDEEEAREEARYLISKLKGYEIDLPLVMDYEFAGGSDGRLYQANQHLSRDEKTAICNAFCDEAEKLGYEAMIYANPTMLYNHLNPDALERLWLAHYAKSTYYTEPYEYWQFSDRGTIPGISGGVDLDFWFDPGGTRPSRRMPFSDVKTGDWFYLSVRTAFEQGLIKGTTETTFSPGETLNRAQLVTMLYRMAGSPKVSGSSDFTDLTQEYYKLPVCWASLEGYVNGYSDTTFGPDDPIIRQDLAVVLYRMAGKPSVKGSLSEYRDTESVSEYAENALQWAVNNGIMQGSDSLLRPKASASRAEASAILVRFLMLMDEVE